MHPESNPLRAEPLPYPDADGEFVRHCFSEMGGQASLEKVEAYVADAVDDYIQRRGIKQCRGDAKAGVLVAQFLENRMFDAVIDALSEPGALDGQEYDLVTRTLRPTREH